MSYRIANNKVLIERNKDDDLKKVNGIYRPGDDSHGRPFRGKVVQVGSRSQSDDYSDCLRTEPGDEVVYEYGSAVKVYLNPEKPDESLDLVHVQHLLAVKVD